MDSQLGIGDGPNKRITLRWYPGGQACTRRAIGLTAATPCSSGTSGLGRDVGYWGRVNTRGEFEENSGFLQPFHTSRFPWHSLLLAVWRILPFAAAALVGAVTALAWQSFLVRPAPPPASRPTLSASAAQVVAPARVPNEAQSPPAHLSPVRLNAGSLAGSVNAGSLTGGSAPARPTPQVLLRKPRAPAAKVSPVRTPRPAVTPAHRGPAIDPDAVLPPTFL